MEPKNLTTEGRLLSAGFRVVFPCIKSNLSCTTLLFAPVFSISGFEIRGNRASDWVLLYLPPDRLFDNEVFFILFPTSLLECIVSFIADNFQATDY